MSPHLIPGSNPDADTFGLSSHLTGCCSERRRLSSSLVLPHLIPGSNPGPDASGPPPIWPDVVQSGGTSPPPWCRRTSYRDQTRTLIHSVSPPIWPNVEKNGGAFLLPGTAVFAFNAPQKSPDTIASRCAPALFAPQPLQRGNGAGALAASLPAPPRPARNATRSDRIIPFSD